VRQVEEEQATGKEENQLATRGLVATEQSVVVGPGAELIKRMKEAAAMKTGMAEGISEASTAGAKMPEVPKPVAKERDDGGRERCSTSSGSSAFTRMPTKTHKKHRKERKEKGRMTAISTTPPQSSGKRSKNNARSSKRHDNKTKAQGRYGGQQRDNKRDIPQGPQEEGAEAKGGCRNICEGQGFHSPTFERRCVGHWKAGRRCFAE
jgi:hypothetical protein